MAFHLNPSRIVTYCLGDSYVIVGEMADGKSLGVLVRDQPYNTFDVCGLSHLPLKNGAGGIPMATNTRDLAITALATQDYGDHTHKVFLTIQLFDVVYNGADLPLNSSEGKDFWPNALPVWKAGESLVAHELTMLSGLTRALMKATWFR